MKYPLLAFGICLTFLLPLTSSYAEDPIPFVCTGENDVRLEGAIQATEPGRYKGSMRSRGLEQKLGIPSAKEIPVSVSRIEEDGNVLKVSFIDTTSLHEALLLFSETRLPTNYRLDLDLENRSGVIGILTNRNTGHSFDYSLIKRINLSCERSDSYELLPATPLWGPGIYVAFLCSGLSGGYIRVEVQTPRGNPRTYEGHISHSGFPRLGLPAKAQRPLSNLEINISSHDADWVTGTFDAGQKDYTFTASLSGSGASTLYKEDGNFADLNCVSDYGSSPQ